MNYLESEQVPKGWEEKPPDKFEIPSGVYVIQCDAGYKEGIAGISTLIITSEKEYKLREYSRRSEGPVHAELLAIYCATKRLNTIRRNITACIIYTDCNSARNLLTTWQAKLPYIQDAVDKIKKETTKLKNCGVSVSICHTKTTNIRRVDRRAGKKRQREENRKQKQIDKRKEEVERAITRGKEVRIYESSGEYFAILRDGGFPPGYKVSLVPLMCECPWWKHHWGNKGQLIANARALPCKHICALLEYLGKDVYQYFSLQISRVD
jgi:ribonuclease HI